MSLTQQELNDLTVYHTMSTEQRAIITLATSAVMRAFTDHEYAARGDDSLAALEAAVVRYFLRSNPEAV